MNNQSSFNNIAYRRIGVSPTAQQFYYCVAPPVGILNFYIMQHNSNKSQKQEALMQLRVLLSCQTAREYQEDLQEMFTGYLASSTADWQDHRIKLTSIFKSLDGFFEVLKTLPHIDQFKN